MVDEMQLLAEMRSDLPEALLNTDRAERLFLEKVSGLRVPPGTPELRRARRRTPLRANRPIGSLITWRAGIAGSLALAVVVFVALGAFGSSPETHQQRSNSNRHLPPPAVSVLHVAAREAAAITPLPEPPATQWIYFRTVQVSDGHRTSSNNWMRFDGGATAYFQNGTLITHLSPFGPPSLRGGSALAIYARTGIPMSAYAALSSLKQSPSAVLRDVRRLLTRNGRRPARALARREFHFLVTLLWTSALVPNRAQANVFDALARLPGVTVQLDQTDAAGQPAVAIGSGQVDNVQLMLDPRSYRVLGMRTTMPKGIIAVPPSPRSGNRPPTRSAASATPSAQRATQSTVTTSIALSRLTLVAKPGER